MIETRGIRNNNPGNIRHSDDRWDGLSPEQTDGEFCQFVDPQHGIRVIAKLMVVYQQKYGCGSVSQIINRWAPPSENDTGDYANFVASRLGVDVNFPIDVTKPSMMLPLVTAIIAEENADYIYPQAVVLEGLRLASMSMGPVGVNNVPPAAPAASQTAADQESWLEKVVSRII